ALRYLLDPAYAASNVGLVTSYIAGAEAYYDYQVNLANANSGLVEEDGTTYTVDAGGTVTVSAPGAEPQTFAPADFDTVGLKAVHVLTPPPTIAYDLLATFTPLLYLPYAAAYGPLLEQVGDQLASPAEALYSCGAFYLSENAPMESWFMNRDPENYDA